MPVPVNPNINTLREHGSTTMVNGRDSSNDVLQNRFSQSGGMTVNTEPAFRCVSRAVLIIAVSILGLTGCGYNAGLSSPPSAQSGSPDYIIGPGDTVNIFVWRNADLSQSVSVRPDGKITTPLVEDIPASGKTPTQLARDMEAALSTYIKNPVVTVIMSGFRGPYSQQIRVVGQATRPQALPYSDRMSLLDVMIAVGGLTEFADGDKATIIRHVDGTRQQYRVDIDALIDRGDMSANVDMLPGDILIIPEAWF